MKIAALAVGLSFCLTGGALAQTQDSASPSQPSTFVAVGHGAPYAGAAAEQPAKSLAEFASQGALSLNLAGPAGQVAHIMPTVELATARANAGLMPAPGGGAATPAGKAGNVNNLAGPLLYHAGGAVMNPYVAVYNIYWAPSKLQTGASTGFSSLYGTVTVLLGAYLPGHGLLNIATQYYQTISGTTTYVSNNGGLGGYYIDTSAYPASGCNDSATPGNCITDAQIQAEITKVMNINGWTGGMNKIYMLYTSSGEGSCFDSGSTSCAYTAYCAYHSYFTLNGQNVIYANQPYGNANGCKSSAQTTPNDLAADLAASTASHEINEAATDPLLNAWFDASGNENGDLCNFNFGTYTWNSNTANQMWNGFFFTLQQEWSNHTNNCLQVGP